MLSKMWIKLSAAFFIRSFLINLRDDLEVRPGLEANSCSSSEEYNRFFVLVCKRTQVCVFECVF